MIKKTCYCENKTCYRYGEKVHRWVPDLSTSDQFCSACGKPLNCNSKDDINTCINIEKNKEK